MRTSNEILLIVAIPLFLLCGSVAYALTFERLFCAARDKWKRIKWSGR